MNKELPVYNIEGTDFFVDAANLQLVEKADPENVIPILEMRDVKDGYVFDYNQKEKNIPSVFGGFSDVVTVKIPQLVDLDPIGMAEKYKCPVHDICGKTDFDLMVDQVALEKRLMGELPTVDILGHTFYVDIRMDMLRPKDDFASNGIVFSHIDDYYVGQLDAYWIPYNPKTHEFQKLDYDKITSIPADLVTISFPHESLLDPIGFNRRGGWDETYQLKETNLKSHFVAGIVDWKETNIRQRIDENLKKIDKQQSKPIKKGQKTGKRQRKGPKL